MQTVFDTAWNRVLSIYNVSKAYTTAYLRYDAHKSAWKHLNLTFFQKPVILEIFTIFQK